MTNFVRSELPAVPVANTLFVSPTGIGEMDGRSPAAAVNFARANELVKPGWTVTVLPGNYTAPVRTTRSGTVKKRIIWRSDGLGAAVISVLPADVIVWMNTANNVDIVGFSISGGRVGIDNTGKSVTIFRNHVHHVGYRCTTAGGSGVYSALDVIIRENVIEDIGVFDPPCDTYHGIIATEDSTIESNVIQRCSGSLKWP